MTASGTVGGRARAPYEVLVAGAGPAGLLCAVELAVRGVRCRVVDRRPGPLPGSRCPTLWQRSLEALASAGLPMAELLDRSLPLERKVFHVAGATAEVDLRSEASPHAFPVLLRQDDLERFLTERLAELGGKVDYGHEVLSVGPDMPGATDVLLRGPGGDERVRVAWAVLATGAGGVTGGGERDAGPARPAAAGELPGMRWVLADVRATAEFAPGPGEEHIFREATGHAGLVPLPGGGHRLFLALPDEACGAGPDGSPTPADVAAAAERMVGLRLATPDAVWSVRPASAVADRFRQGRRLLLGDAARRFPMPVHGLNTGLQDALGLGWKLATAVRRPAVAEELLDTYDAERRAAAEGVRDRAERVLGYGSTVPVEVIRDRLLRRVFDIRTEPVPRYAPGPLTDPDSPLGGSPAPFATAGGVFPAWRLVVRHRAGEAVPGWLVGRLEALTREFGLPLVIAAGDMASAGVHAYLVRPDGYVSFDGGPGRLAALAQHLTRVRRFL
ncbi:FAD-dependent monooxygenase [Streptomyces acidicola]|uniref:FAD-dependent monooxygenase n=1 Tax=Streptomyces acidicola TaxID=2596892 RepID=UPI00380C189A